MRRTFTNIPLLILVAVTCTSYSIYLDWGTVSWIWFQRSGSLLALIGAILGYRSIVRLGVDGVGGVSPTIIRGQVVSVDDSGPVQKMKVAYDEETRKIIHQAAIDRAAGYIGSYMLVAGTLIWGYGDLIGQLRP